MHLLCGKDKKPNLSAAHMLLWHLCMITPGSSLSGSFSLFHTLLYISRTFLFCHLTFLYENLLCLLILSSIDASIMVSFEALKIIYKNSSYSG